MTRVLVLMCVLVQGKAATFGELRGALSSARTKPFQMLSITAWNDARGAYSTLTHSKEFELGVITELLLHTFI